MSRPFGGQSWTVCAINEARAGAIPPSSPETIYSVGRRWQIVERRNSVQIRSTEITFPTCHCIDRCRLQTVRRTRAHGKIKPENRVDQKIKSQCKLSDRSNRT